MAESGRAVLVVGKNSFIAGHLLKVLPKDGVRAVSHDALSRPDLLDGVGTVINAARHPASGQADYDPEALDPDLLLARRIGERDIDMIMLSSRKVYAPSDQPLAETSPTGPVDAYGANKLRAEQRVAAILGERLTILRLANIFGDERIPGRRSFLAMLLNRLSEQNQIRYDMSPFVERDFLPVETLATLLARIVREPPGGIMNIGSGLALPTGRLALWIMEGFGGGELLIDCPEEKDRFVLDIGKLEARFGQPCAMDDLKRRCLALGEALRTDQERLRRPG
ncbi:MAG: NAD-dependent epimerase/dehydratase family protein [Geminicoccaceae bacterium]